MRVCRTIIAVSMPLLIASQAAAQGPVDGTARYSNSGLSALSRMVRAPLAAPVLAEEERLSAPRGAVVGSLPIAGNLSLQVGLLKVIRARNGERPLARIQPMRDTGGSRQERIAAAGLSFRF